MELKISNIQNFSLHDGPGIRTTIFLNGCPLRCLWCHNPETQSTQNALIFDTKKCIGCGRCGKCSFGVHIFDGSHKIFRDKCTACGECVNNCPTSALDFSIKTLSKKEFCDLVNKQKRLSPTDGGITFSGGEPLMQGEAILSYIDGIDINFAIETCGYANEDLFKKVIEKMDYIMFDLKLAKKNLHEKYTGVSNELILKNLENLRKSGKDFILRTPLIPGITDTEENLSAIAKIVGNDPWEKLPYNTMTPSKYERLGLNYKLQ